MSGEASGEKAPNFSLKVKLWCAAAMLLVYVVFSMFLNNDKAFIASCSLWAIAVAVYADRHLRRKVWFWMLMAFWVIVHTFAIININWRVDGPAIAFQPLFILDYLVVALSPTLLERLGFR